MVGLVRARVRDIVTDDSSCINVSGLSSAKLWYPQLDGTSSGLPVAIAIAVTLSKSKVVLFAVGRTGLRADLQLHQLLGRKANHLAQQIGKQRSSQQASAGPSYHWSSVVFQKVVLEQPNPTGRGRWPPLSTYAT